jgi:hypothetical protein
MWQIYERKVIVLNWGGLAWVADKREVTHSDKPYSDIWLKCKKSAEVIVPTKKM